MASRASSSRLRFTKSKQQPSRNRRAGRGVSYREESSDSNEFDDPPSQHDYKPAPSPPSRSSRPSRRRPAPTPSAKVSTKRKATGLSRRTYSGVKRAKTNHNRVLARQKEQDNTAIQLTGKAMPWDALPYQILALIFEYASWPLVADAITPLPSVSWLLSTALCCKAFAEPALSALYYSPPLTRKDFPLHYILPTR